MIQVLTTAVCVLLAILIFVVIHGNKIWKERNDALFDLQIERKDASDLRLKLADLQHQITREQDFHSATRDQARKDADQAFLAIRTIEKRYDQQRAINADLLSDRILSPNALKAVIKRKASGMTLRCNVTVSFNERLISLAKNHPEDAPSNPLVQTVALNVGRVICQAAREQAVILEF